MTIYPINNTETLCHLSKLSFFTICNYCDDNLSFLFVFDLCRLLKSNTHMSNKRI